MKYNSEFLELLHWVKKFQSGLWEWLPRAYIEKFYFTEAGQDGELAGVLFLFIFQVQVQESLPIPIPRLSVFVQVGSYLICYKCAPNLSIRMQ